MISAETLKKWVLEQGFDACGIARCEAVDAFAAKHVRAYLSEGRQATMSYMNRYLDRRLDPRLLMEGAQSVVACLAVYAEPVQQAPEAPRIARFAFGDDYHEILKTALKNVLRKIQAVEPLVEGRVFVDTAPLLEKYWAAQAGLGWIGKNTLLIHPDYGSFACLGFLLLDLPLEADQAIGSRCGDCHKCLDACPNKALKAPGCLDARRCLSYQTIEQSASEAGPISTFPPTLFGCDRCQEVCPYNQNALPMAVREPQGLPLLRGNPAPFVAWQAGDWLAVTEPEFLQMMAKSPLKRAGYEKIRERLLKNLERSQTK